MRESAAGEGKREQRRRRWGGDKLKSRGEEVKRQDSSGDER